MLNTPNMQRIVAIALVGLATLAMLQSPTALAQGGIDRRLATATKLECSFSTFAMANWDKSTPSLTVKPAELKASFSHINVDEGTAEAETDYGASFISVRYAQGYLHIMQMSDAGPLYLTTVIARPAGEGRFLAVHTRLEYTPTVIPGFTSRPEVYVGSCSIG